MRSHILVGLLVVASSCDGGGSAKSDAGVDSFVFPDAPDTPPTLTSFYPTPANVQPGVPTAITWAWTYLVDPPVPTPTCMIDNGVGTVTNGQTTMVTLNATTAYRLTCSNRAGMTARDTVVSIPPAPPTLATFTATPSPVMPNQAANVTFTWTFSTSPSPTPTCTIDGGVGMAPAGATTMMSSLTLGQARTFRLRCTNTQGTSFRDATVAVNECAGGTHDCNANATCTDTVEGFTCTCNAGYTGNGDVCSATANCGMTPSLCDVNAQCIGTSSCVCNAGYFGTGTTCTRARLTFVSTATGTGNISVAGGWTTAGVATGAAAADAICQAEATAAALPGTYVAWISDSTTDAYCRVHGLTGKKSAMCGLGALPVAAGPWVRTDAARSPAAPTIDKLLMPTRQTFNPVTYRANGVDTAGTAPQLVFTGTDDTGVLTGTACTDWTLSSGTAAMGDTMGGGTSWTDQGSDPSCGTTGRLRCVEVGTGPALPSRHPVGRKAFVTSVSGGAILSQWADANGQSSITAADEICKARARYAGYANAQNFEAWLTYSTSSASVRVTSAGPWYRPDGILFATRSQLTGGSLGRISAPLYQAETNAYIAGNADTSSVWTSTLYNGSYYSSSSLYSCSYWGTNSSSYYSLLGRTDLADFRWVSIGTSYSSPSLQSCTATDYRLYCLEDTP